MLSFDPMIMIHASRKRHSLELIKDVNYSSSFVHQKIIVFPNACKDFQWKISFCFPNTSISQTTALAIAKVSYELPEYSFVT